MKLKKYLPPLLLLAAVTVGLLFALRQTHPATLTQLLTGQTQMSPQSITVTSWPNSKQNTFTVTDAAVLEEITALMGRTRLTERDVPLPHFPDQGCYRFSVDGGREVLTDGVYLYDEERGRAYTAQTLPALLSALYRADERAQFYAAGDAVLPPSSTRNNLSLDLQAQLQAFGLDAPGEVYVLCP